MLSSLSQCLPCGVSGCCIVILLSLGQCLPCGVSGCCIVILLSLNQCLPCGVSGCCDSACHAAYYVVLLFYLRLSSVYLFFSSASYVVQLLPLSFFMVR